MTDELLRKQDVKVGDTFPTEQDLCAQFNASRTAVRTAIAQAETAPDLRRWVKQWGCTVISHCSPLLAYLGGVRPEAVRHLRALEKLVLSLSPCFGMNIAPDELTHGPRAPGPSRRSSTAGASARAW